MRMSPHRLCLLVCCLFAPACDFKQKQTLYSYDPARALHREFNGDSALAHVQAQVALGPRPAGSAALDQCRAYLTQQLKGFGWDVQPQSFKEYTSKGEITFTNLRARLPLAAGISDTWARPCAVLVGSHFDTKLFGSFAFVGANDGASSTGVLLEMARILGQRPDAGQFLELAFFDGEEAILDYGEDPATRLPKDGLYGSRHYAKLMRELPRIQRPLFMFLLDMVGDKNLLVKIPSNSTPILTRLLMESASDLQYRKYFAEGSGEIIDDHLPFLRSGIPAIDIIDLDFAPWHTSSDNLDQISAESMKIVGQTTLLALEKLLSTTAPP